MSSVSGANLVLREPDKKWQFNIKGESLNISGIKTPETASIESKDDIEGALLEKVYLYEKLISFTTKLYEMFISARLSKDWDFESTELKKWAHESHEGAVVH